MNTIEDQADAVEQLGESRASGESQPDPSPVCEESRSGVELPSAVLPPGGLTREHAEAQAVVLAKASRLCPVRQTRFLLDAMGKEWAGAAAGMLEAESYGDPAVIELCGSLTRGMSLWLNDVGWMSVNRILRRPGDFAVECTITDVRQLSGTDNKRKVYENMFGDESPVVVQA
jgi:hypothetical protein